MLIAKIYDFSDWKEKFIDYLEKLEDDNGKKKYNLSTAKDYARRIERIAENEGITIQTLAVEIDRWIAENKTGKYAQINKTSHYAWSSALIKFKVFLPTLCKPYDPQSTDPLKQFTKKFPDDLIY